ncbi:hypothetical protein [Hydrocoleum sp. CS-953]|nr:hypothetical protein [Hydrocoleum sp. CS-953]
MNKYKSFLPLAGLVIGFLGAPVSAKAFTLGGVINGEEAFEQFRCNI